ncbi:MAG: TonB-dependent receptor [Gemmatimonadetes bacterium]|nr:TonB-dependent receptor [Gemmatimonadota bacterium]
MIDSFPGSFRSARALVLALAGSVALARPIAAQQQTGRITGRVIEASSGQGLADVGVQVVGTTLGTSSGVDGRFTLPAVPAGTVTLQFRRIGFTPKTVTGIMLEAETSLEQNVTLTTAAIQLASQTVTASAERGSVNEALDAQRTATGVVNAITSEQIARSPDSDAAQAVQRVSGVTVQDGKYVFVRGLGERYTTTQLNGTRVPSPEPERRVVPLDMFPSNLLESITTSKTFTPDQQGDFSGALVEIKTREFPARTQFAYSLTMGANSGATGSTLLRGRNVGGEQFAMAGAERALPYVFGVLQNFQGINLNPSDKSYLISQFRNAWTPTERSGGPNTSTNLSVGGSQPVLGQRIGYLVSGTYAYTQDLRDNQVRALADRGNTPGETREIDRFAGQTASQGVLWGGLANFSTLLGGNSRILFNNTYNRTADNDARRERGSFENEGINARIDRMQYVERSVRSNQVAGEHQLGGRRLDWAVTSSGVTRDEPDRSEFVYVIEQDSPNDPETLRWLNTGNGGAVRTFSRLAEDSREGRANYQQPFTFLGGQHSVKVGGLYRRTDRDANTTAYALAAPLASLAVRELPPEQLFAGPFSGNRAGIFDIFPLAQGGSYRADDRLAAGYVMADLALGDRVHLITGARYEQDRLTVDAQSTLGAPISTQKSWNDVLPSLALNIKLTDWQNLRISASQTLARPEYRELVPIKSRDVLNGDDVEGNADLQRTRIQNADVRWEFYPSSGEVLSLGVFAKSFDRPIERVYRAAGASSRFISYVNADRATNYGLEVEARKGLDFLGAIGRPLVVFSNLTLMQSKIDLGSAQAAATNQTRRMVGQAPYVINTGITYATTRGGTSATLLFNRTGDRIDAAGDLPLPDVIQVARNVMDVSVRFPIVGPFQGRLDARNLLDEPFKTVQGTVIREAWTVGRTFQLGVSFRP